MKMVKKSGQMWVSTYHFSSLTNNNHCNAITWDS